MKLYHWTKRENVDSILRIGLKPSSSLGIVYLTPVPELTKDFGDTLLEVETEDLKLTAFEDCKEWEVLCWGHILAKNIKISLEI